MKLFEQTNRALITLLMALFVLAAIPACSSSSEKSDAPTEQSGSDNNCDQAFTSEERRDCLEKLD